jgi:putative copper resistance protein D
VTIAAGIVVSRLLHYLAVSVVFGAGFFPLYAIELPLLAAYGVLAWLPRFLLCAALLAVVSGVFWLIFAAAEMSGSLAGAFDSTTLSMIARETNFGRIWTARFVLAVVLTALLFLKPTPPRIYGVVFGSAILLVSLAGMGRAGGGTGVPAAVHVVTDALHLLASSIWIGALVAFVTMLMISRRTRLERDAITVRKALDRFSEIGGVMVAVLVITGLNNPNVGTSFGTPYGQLLLMKFAFFGAMLLLAAANRFWLTPKLASALSSNRRSEGPIRALFASILAETAIALLVFATVAWLATFSPQAL